MNKIINLNRNTLARLAAREPCLLPDNLSLTFESNYDLSNAFIVLQNGTIKENYRLTKTFDVPEKFLFTGNLNVSVKLYIDGELVKCWSVLPIRIVETDDGIEAFDFLTDLEERLKNMEKIHEII